MQVRRSVVSVVMALGAWAAPAAAQSPAPAAMPSTAARLAQLVDTPGVSGREDHVRDLVRSMLPTWAAPRVDELGNLIVSIGSGTPSTLLVAPLDEDGYVVSGIAEDGYLRLHRPTREPAHRLLDQFHIGQPVLIHTRKSGAVPGVTATPSTHLRRYLPADEANRIKGLEDLWVDVGAENRAQVDQLGIRMLDSVTLRERGSMLAGGRVSGPGAQGRAAALALVELVRAWTEAPRVTGTLTLAWTTQSLFGGRGLNRLIESTRPQRIVLCGPASPARGKDGDPRGAIGSLGGGPLVATEDASMLDAARDAGIKPQTVPADRLPFRRPAGWDGIVQMVAAPVLFAQTPVETVDAHDVVAVARLAGALTGTPRPEWREPDAAGSRPAEPASLAPEAGRSMLSALKPVLEAYGVSGHEERPRDVVRRLIIEQVAPWAKPRVDERGNLVVTVGTGKDEIVFIAHLDELGYEITAIRDDGTASVRGRGGMFDSLYEAHPVLVHTASGPVPAVLAPRSGYTAAETSQPRTEDLALYFGASSAADVRALGVAQGDAATVRKTLLRLAGSRVAGRSMDDRSGSTALLLALGRIDPVRVAAKITFIWSVQEETGLAGAAFAASQLRPRYAFAVDTFVSTDSPFDTKRLAHIPLGSGSVLRAMDNSTSSPPDLLDRLVELSRRRKIPMTIGVTSGGTDASAFSRYGGIDAGLSWPGRYSHSPAEVTDLRDLEAVVTLIVAVATERW